MEIRHKTISTPDNQIDGDDWNDKHNVTPMLLGYELVEEKVLPAGTTSCVFDGLNGDVDEEYLIESSNVTTVAPGSADYSLRVLPNGVITEQKLVLSRARQDQIFKWTDTVFSVMISSYNQQFVGRFTAKIFCKTGGYRYVKGESFVISSGYYDNQNFAGYWSNTTNNITNLTVNISGGSFSGTIRLWKRIKEVS
jgi:hypothetical protein